MAKVTPKMLREALAEAGAQMAAKRGMSPEQIAEERARGLPPEMEEYLTLAALELTKRIGS